MASDPVPSLDEIALGAFLEDIGKFMQRAHAGNGELPQQVINRASVVLPGFQGRSSHWHALWTDAFFDEIERRGVSLPGGINLACVRDAAVYHHNPGSPLQWLSAEADRLSAGMDRKPRDEQDEAQDPGARGGFRKVALRSIFAGVELGRGARPLAASCAHSVAEMTPAALVPGVIDGATQAESYRALWPQFVDAFEALCHNAHSAAALHDGLVSLSERFTWAIPSSTVDQPDVPLHDHDKSVAAIASCLYLFHAERGELADTGRIRDRDAPKFHFLVGDLSGIQSSLFRLAAQQVKGAARILRARSFLMAAIVEAAALLCRQAFDLPAYCELQTAGGRFVLLVPALPNAEQRIETVRRKLDSWICERYSGDLAVNLALGPVLSGRDLMRERFAATWAAIGHSAEEAKLRALSTVELGVLAHDFDERGPCPACGVRPATVASSDRILRCVACNDEFETGRRLPDTCAVLWVEGELPGDLAAHNVTMPGGLRLALLTAPLRLDDADAWRRVRGGWRIANTEAGASPPAIRHIATHVPRLTAADLADRRFASIDEEFEAGDIKTFAHLAELSREKRGEGFAGRPMLGVLKADVDMLGQVFGRGLGAERSLGRMATLSRMTDSFFTVVLPDLLRREFPDTYTVYAGGDDL
ncbi:MAG: type III-A CRISPR-associated protein Cas10/Csm1, partial [Alphaproteobacteria bacterium]|nr:type III-A CRISPR-associated protein Cas10/Csm1 [Alphaproteobacteria bacterium]